MRRGEKETERMVVGVRKLLVLVFGVVSATLLRILTPEVGQKETEVSYGED